MTLNYLFSVVLVLFLLANLLYLDAEMCARLDYDIMTVMMMVSPVTTMLGISKMWGSQC